VDPEDKKLLEETYKLVSENNSMLRTVKRSMQISRVMSILYWVFIIGSAVGALYFIKPYLESIYGVYGGAKTDFNSILENFKQ